MSPNVANGPQRLHATTAKEPIVPGRGGVAYAVWILGLATFLTLSGAFDTDGLGALHSFSLWAVFCALFVAQVSGFDLALRRWTQFSALFAGLAAIALTVPGMTLALLILKQTPLTPGWWGHDPVLDLMSFVAAPVSLMAGLTLMLTPRINPRSQNAKWSAPPWRPLKLAYAKPAIAGLLPPPQQVGATVAGWPRRDVIWVKAHDHYLEVTTEEGPVFVRGRMKDAIACLKDADGLQVHRSWWVARTAVASVHRHGRTFILELSDGQHVRVARSKRKALTDQGWVSGSFNCGAG